MRGVPEMLAKFYKTFVSIATLSTNHWNHIISAAKSEKKSNLPFLSLDNKNCQQLGTDKLRSIVTSQVLG